MPTKKITYVIGAGASTEVGLPDGRALKDDVRSLLEIRFDDFGRLERGEPKIIDALRQVATERQRGNQSINEFLPAVHLILQGLPQAISIDNFLDNHAGNTDVAFCGKLAISLAILQSERKSVLFTKSDFGEPTINVSALSKTWLYSLFQLLTEGCKAADLEARLSNYSFVVFNYDRCLEHYLSVAISNYYGLSFSDSVGIVSRIKLIHPYGSVGDIFSTGPARVEFGAAPGAARLREIGIGLRTFTERVDSESQILQDMRATIAESDVLMFLGFAYHKQNIELLGQELPTVRRGQTVCLGTAFGLSRQNIDVIRSDLFAHLDIYSSATDLAPDLKCAPAMQSFWRQLSVR
jgi:hypothetical protein